MPDEGDIANDRAELLREQALAIRKPVPPCTGKCLNCQEPVIHRFCNVDCQQDYELRHRQGKA